MAAAPSGYWLREESQTEKVSEFSELLIFGDDFAVFNLQVRDVGGKLQLFAIFGRLHHFADSGFQRGLRDRQRANLAADRLEAQEATFGAYPASELATHSLNST